MKLIYLLAKKRNSLILLFFFATSITAESRVKERYFTDTAHSGFSIGLAAGIGQIDQAGLNKSIQISRAYAGATTSSMKTSTEYAFFGMYQFEDKDIAIQLRPTLFSQSSDGRGPAGQYNYEVKGHTFFPLIRWIAYSTKSVDFYLHGGAGYGELKGSIVNDTRSVDFKGKAYGTQAGLGVNIYFGPTNSIGFEANYRYLPIQKNTITKIQGTPNGVNPAIPGQELENTDGNNINTYLSGTVGYIIYSINF